MRAGSRVRLSDDLSLRLGHVHRANKSTPQHVAGMSMGRHWIELTNAGGGIPVYMQAANDMQAAAARDRNNSHTIWLNEQDMDDVFAILSHGSNVIIQQR